jgi:hypothetical protein
MTKAASRKGRRFFMRRCTACVRWPRGAKQKARAISSAVERFLYTEDVGGSIPSSPTIPRAAHDLDWPRYRRSHAQRFFQIDFARAFTSSDLELRKRCRSYSACVARASVELIVSLCAAFP